MKHVFICLYSILICCLACNAQDLSRYTPKKLKALGDNALEIGDTYSARDYYKAYCEQKTNAKVLFLLAECYRTNREYMAAARYYNKAYRENRKNLLALYHYGEMLKIYGYYKDAKDQFQVFKQQYKGGYDKDYKHMVVAQIAFCDSALNNTDSISKAEVRRLNEGINKESIEFSPLYLNDSTLIYASMRTDTAVYIIMNEQESDIPYRQFYTAKKRKGEWTFTNEWMEGEFNKNAIHSGNGTFSADRKRFYFTRCEQNWRYQTLCKIYVSSFSRGEWTTPEALPDNINMKNTTNTQPAIGNDSKRGCEILYFSSDRPGGKGGLDIWYSMLDCKTGSWTEPKNCGNKINTSADEVTPFYNQAERTLYFSSNGWGGFGELDIYKSIGESARWTEAENIGSSINSGFDDLYYTTNTTNSEGFFTSNRPVDTQGSTCCDDIFSYKYVDRLSIGVDGKVFLLKNAGIEEILRNEMETDAAPHNDSTKYLQGSVVSLYMLDDETKERYFISTDTTDVDGQYFFNLHENKDYVLQYESSRISPPERAVSTKGMTYSDTLHLEDMGIDYISRDIFRIKNIYYEFDKANLTLESKRRITKTVLFIMKEYPQIVVEIGSHTDSKGSDNYNIKLSQRRAESVVNYLIDNGIAKERLRAKGYGETRPIAPNENEDGSDNPEGRAKNRRTEFRVIGTINQYFEIIYEE